MTSRIVLRSTARPGWGPGLIASVGLHAAALVGLIAYVGAVRSREADEAERVRLTFYEAPPTPPPPPAAGGGSPEPEAPAPIPEPVRPRRTPRRQLPPEPLPLPIPEPAPEPIAPDPSVLPEPTAPAITEPAPCVGDECTTEHGSTGPTGGGSGGGTGGGTGTGTGSGTGAGTGGGARAMELMPGMAPPRATSAPQDRIREALRRVPRGSTVTVVVRVEIAADGRVRAVTIVRGHPLLDAAVRTQLMSWRYRPAIWQGRPVAIFKNEVLRLSLQEN